jgi:hypothetical protein
MPFWAQQYKKSHQKSRSPALEGVDVSPATPEELKHIEMLNESDITPEMEKQHILEKFRHGLFKGDKELFLMNEDPAEREEFREAIEMGERRKRKLQMVQERKKRNEGFPGEADLETEGKSLSAAEKEVYTKSKKERDILRKDIPANSKPKTLDDIKKKRKLLETSG